MRVSRVLFLSSLTALCSLNVVAQTRPSPASGYPRVVPQPLQIFGFDAFPAKQGRLLPRNAQEALATTDPPQKSQTCFTMRSYLFHRDPASDVPRLAGSSTCQNAGKFKMKEAMAAPASAPR